MDVGWQIKLLFLVLLFIASAFFSGSEVALFSLDRKKMKKDVNRSAVIRRYLNLLLDNPRRLLVTILIGNTVVNVAASIVAVSLALDYMKISGLSKDFILTLQIIILTILIVIFGELIPKVWASKNPASFSNTVAVPLYWVSVLIYPIAEIITESIKMLISRLKVDKTKLAISSEEITELANLSHEKGALVEEEQGLIQSVVNFKSVTVHEVMTPRVDMVAISEDTKFNELLTIITSSGHSRIPLYREHLDEIIGIIYAKDMLPYMKDPSLRQSLSLSKIARKPFYVPRTKLISTLLHEFQEKNTHVAIVVDEYGGTAGLVALEDVIEEIIGEIRDEYDKEENPVKKIEDNKYIVLGKLPIDDLNELLNTTIASEDEDFETVAGLVLSHAGHIPKEGYSFKLENHKFTVEEILNKRINKVQIEKVPSE